MPKPPRRPSHQIKKSTAVAAERVAGRALIEKPVDLRQVALFDAPLPKWIMEVT
jgi:hypothetical protein